MKNYIMLVAACTTLGACSQTKSISTLEKKIPTTYAEKVDGVKEQVAIIPDWYLKPPKNDKAIYSSGTSASPDLQLSMDIAILNAKTILADRINGRVRSKTKSFISRIGSDVDAAVLQEVEKATTNLIADVDVGGYRVDKSTVKVNGKLYRSYVLLEYSDSEANKIIMNRLRKDRILLSKIRSTKAFKDLDISAEKKHEADSIKSENNAKIELGIIGGDDD